MKDEAQVLASERSVIGSCLIEPREALPLAAQIVAPPHFLAPAHRHLFTVLLAMDEAGEPIDAQTIATEMERRKWLEDAGGVAAIVQLMSRTPTAAHVEKYARDVRRAAKTRQQIQDLQSALAAAQDPAYDPDAGAGKVVRRLTEETDSHDLTTMDVALAEASAQAAKECRPLVTGCGRLDGFVSWLPEDGVMQVSAPAGTGKTAWGMQALTQEIQRGGYALMFSAEMSRTAIARRVFAHLSGLDMRKPSDTWTGEDVNKSLQVTQRLSDIGKRWWIDDTPNIPVDLLVARAHLVNLRAKQAQERAGEEPRGLDLILVDYLQTLGVRRGEKPESLEQQVTQAGQNLTALARRLSTRVIIITSLAKDGGTRYSGAVDFQVDLRITLERPDPAGDLVNAKIVKARDGEQGAVTLRFNGKTYTYADSNAPPPAEAPPKRGRWGGTEPFPAT